MANNYGHGDVIIRFNEVTFGYNTRTTLLEEADFSVRERAKMTLMGQNGAGKSTIFKMILGQLTPEEGSINIRKGASIAIANQVVEPHELDKNLIEYFSSAFREKVYDIEPRIYKILDVVNLKADLNKKVSQFSGGEQARLLLAFALIQNPDILLLDEPTNNLDKVGIDKITQFLKDYNKTVIVISHDAEFLNAFTHGVLYLDGFKRKVEQYVGNYNKVIADIKERIERERRENSRLEKEIQDRKEKMNFFAQKGGHMRDVARKMREAIEELEEQLVGVRQEDKTISKFRVSSSPITGSILKINSVPIIKNGKSVRVGVELNLKSGSRLLLSGPNGIGKTTLLKNLVGILKSEEKKGEKLGNDKYEVEVNPDFVMSYYAQDFSELDEEKTAFEVLDLAAKSGTEERIRGVAAQFLITEELLKNKISQLSYGQKGLVNLAKIVLQEPNVLIMDEPTNHINFRHLPVIADALANYQGVLILVSHMREFVEECKMTEYLDLGRF